MNVQSHIADINTPTGVMRTYIHRPVGAGKYPAILFYSEIFQQTGPIESAAKIMASHGYVVLVPEVFHELNPIGTVLGYDDAGRDKGNADKAAKPQFYDAAATEEAPNSNSAATYVLIAGAIVLVGAGGYFMMRKKKN